MTVKNASSFERDRKSKGVNASAGNDSNGTNYFMFPRNLPQDPLNGPQKPEYLIALTTSLGGLLFKVPFGMFGMLWVVKKRGGKESVQCK